MPVMPPSPAQRPDSTSNTYDQDSAVDFTSWRHLRPGVTPESLRLLGITPLERADLSLARAFCKQKAAIAIDLGRHADSHAAVFAFIAGLPAVLANAGYCGIRIPDQVAVKPEDLPETTGFVVLTAERKLKPWLARLPVVVQVTTLDEARAALASGAHGLIVKGQESGGLVGEESAYILLQRVQDYLEIQQIRIPMWCQGGMGLHTAAGAIAGGAFGIVLDSQLTLLSECQLDEAIKADIRAMDGSQTRLLGGYSVYSRPGLPVADHDALPAEDVRRLLSLSDGTALWPVGQDAALAGALAVQCTNLENLLNSLRMSIAGHLRQAVQLEPLAENTSLARAHGMRYPIAQGPMTRVSDSAGFAAAVAENGALPFLALSLMREDAARKLLEETRQAVGGRSWGVGVLGFAPAETLNPQLALIQEFRPTVALLAGGRPSQARMLVEQGIPAYLHVPSPGLLGLFLKDGARHFVFEGRECGGHIGPRFSFVLWEQQLQILQAFERPEELHILFAGGIHDARSAAMVAALSASLAARGAKIGVLMGSAYIMTSEAVRHGAVNETFQKKVLAGGSTTLLETAPGHATRCLDTDFVDQFNAEKQRLQQAGLAQQAIWQALENFNVGRLRVASKGVRREGERLVKLNSKMQQTEGMYMIGQVVAMRHQVTHMADLHVAISEGSAQRLRQCSPPALPRADNAEPIAVVGMSCIYPGSPDLDTYWANIVEGHSLVTEVPAERWNVDLYYQQGYQQGPLGKGKTPSKWGGFIDAVAFDPLRYGIPPQSLAAIEPAQLLSLEAARSALADAGYGDEGQSGRFFDREKTSVIFGAESGTDLLNAYVFRNSYAQYLGEMPAELDAVLPELTEDSFPGILVNVIAGRIANRLGLGGVNYSVDAACASSLTAIELAVKELRSGSSDMVLAGGADFHNSINDFLMFASVKALSPSGLCRSFDETADGICLGEGVGVVVLKRLSDAERDGDRIYAVINGVAGSSDGKGLGLTAPRKEGQKRALERAYWQAGVLPGEVGLVEAHGTGTVVGDRTELQTLTEIYTAGGALPHSAGLGSVKSQIGHTKCAAGIAGFIKVAKALHHRVLPPTLHISKPNAGYDAMHSPFMLNRQAAPWPRATGEVARASVSAFGFGGTNFHTVLSAYDDQRESAALPQTGNAQWSAELFVFRGQSLTEADRQLQQLAQLLRDSDAPLRLRDLAYSVACRGGGEVAGPVQISIVAQDSRDLLNKLDAAQRREKLAGVYWRQTAIQGKLAFVFPGQGSQSPGMLQDLFVAFPALQRILQQGAAWRDALFPPTAYTREQQQQQQKVITDTRVAQPTLGMVDYAMATLLQSFGIKPDMLAGHSYGELVALAVAGCYELPELLHLSEQRGMAILAAAGDDPGRMAAVSAGSDELAALFADDSGVVLANQNSPRQTVISGSAAAIEAALELLKEKGLAARAIEVACAFHSPVVAAAEQSFAAILADVDLQKPATVVYSNVSARPYPGGVKRIKQQLAAQIAKPVRFVEQIEQMYADGARIFVEAGPARVLSGLIEKILADRPHLVVATDQKGQPGIPTLLTALAQLAVALDGQTQPLGLEALWAGREARLLDLSQAQKLAATCWLIDGARARPRHGEAPRHAGKIVTQPLALPQAGGQPGAGAAQLLQAPADQAVFHYLHNMRDLVQAQRDVMMGLLGAPLQPSTVVASAALMPTQTARLEAAADAPVPAVVASNTSNNHGDVAEILLAIVSERTGYPVDMLDPALDLEGDLSIDSIKRVEIMGELSERIGLRRQLGDAADAMLEQLSAQKTLQAISHWLHEHLPPANSGQPATAQPAASSTPSTPSTSAAPASTAADAQQVLLAIVSERTGYPQEVLELDLDLEADLSVDSIKRLEIVGELFSRLGLQNVLSDKDAALDTLAALKTLRAMVDWLTLNAGGGQASTAATGGRQADDAGAVGQASDSPIALSRYVLQSVKAPQARVGTAPFAGKHFLITDDELGVATRLAARLQAHGASTQVISFSEHATLPENLAQVDGLIHLFGLNSIARVRDAKRFFDLVRDTLLHKASYLLVASGLGGNFGRKGDSAEEVPEDFGHGAGMAGMLKTVAREWPEVKVHYVDLDISEPADELAAYLEIELLAENPLTEVSYREGHRHLLKVVESALPLSAEINQLELDKHSVVMLTGGARGITAQLAVALARRYGCQLELAGRSPLPQSEEDAATRAATDLKALRQLLIQQHPELKPVDIEQRCSQILAAREIRNTFAQIEAAGGQVNYTAIDVRDIDAFAAYIEGLYQRHGRLDGVIHGAGVVEDKLLRHKTAESFQRVFDTKVRGALMLYKLLREDVRFVVFFSSVASAFGNKGQVDYATANDVLDKIAHALQLRVKGRVLSVNWGPWAGTGMVSAELEREYARKGIGLIPLEAGVTALLQELQFGRREDTQVVFMCATPESMGMAY
ncbi:MAG: SDR family NAD(P)-dependent oxidoreductase [Sterolibacterium sp.]|nr:SDR family NAD(P)-dependent oxidoreductase [Sterolibacterium sp.]